MILTDTFPPILNPITVTGAFATLPGQITVPAATFTRNEDGSFTVVPGVASIVVTGSV